MADLRLVRQLTGWPEAVPDDVLYAHQAEADAELMRVVGVAAAPEGAADVWDRAQAWLTAASAVSAVHLFALSGAARVGRIEGAVEFRFLTPAEQAALAAEWRGRGLALAAELAALVAVEVAADAPADTVSLGSGYMAAI